MKFLDSIKSGIAKAEAADQNLNAVTAIFSELNAELSDYTDGKLKITRTMSLNSKVAAISAMGLESPASENTKSDIISLSSKTENKIYAEVARWRQHVSGFPCMLSFEGREYICENIEDLKAALGELLSSVIFGKALSKALL
ncbi:hypothetical protein B0D71_00880 [Pseudomonas laurylsulfativorans]|uniref:Uncharacterized protein n=1 Tax=Pseudomonas laurylsulfativorans TaxID=1943631 RepID=A0A2S3VU07_9PSED|nr:hypothetical protein [Pseudomonas laurylsulfativorans]POF43401.1 hypothetical protein B0D71_00880 [Pseudomonas laurylsulfativorans]